MAAAVDGVGLQRPRVKDVFGVLKLDGRVRLGGGYAYVSEIEDPSGVYGRLLDLLDGEHERAAIVAAMAGQLDARSVNECLEILADAGCLEDSAITVPSELSAAEVARYKGNLNFFSVLEHHSSKYDCQLRLKRTTGVLFGLGGIGSNVCTALAELGVGRLVGIDFDRVELGNLNRQVLYRTDAVGRPKVEVAAERLREFNSEIEFIPVQRRIAGLEDVRELLRTYPADFVVNLADKPNGYIDHCINQACVERGVALFAGSSFCGVGTAYSVVPRASACYACRVASELAESPQLGEELEHVRRHGVNDANGALGLTCMFQAYVVGSEILRHVLGLPLLLTHRTLEIDFLTFAQTLHRFERREDCQVCARAMEAAAT